MNTTNTIQEPKREVGSISCFCSVLITWCHQSQFCWSTEIISTIVVINLLTRILTGYHQVVDSLRRCSIATAIEVGRPCINLRVTIKDLQVGSLKSISNGCVNLIENQFILCVFVSDTTNLMQEIASLQSMCQGTPLGYVATEKNIIATGILHVTGIVEVSDSSIEQLEDVLVDVLLLINVRSRNLECLRARNIAKEVCHNTPVECSENLSHALDVFLTSTVTILVTLLNHLLDVIEVEVSTIPLVIECRASGNLIYTTQFCILRLVVTSTQQLLCIRSHIP